MHARSRQTLLPAKSANAGGVLVSYAQNNSRSLHNQEGWAALIVLQSKCLLCQCSVRAEML